jgi:dTDP-glucose 4,6-dehydratase
MKNYLVTGGAGFIGSNYIHYMFEKYGNEISIINLDLLTYAGNLENLKEVKNLNYKFIKGDICDKNLVEKVFKDNKIDYVIHFAAESHVDRSIENPEVFVQTNVIGTLVLLNIAKQNWQNSDNTYTNGSKFVHVSTDEVYGSLGETGYFTENTPIDPRSPYSASKASSDLLVKAYYETYGMPINITRCSNNYGAFQFPEKLIPLMIKNALNGENLPVYGNGKNIRDWLYVKDHVNAIDMVTSKGKLGEVYNIGGYNEKRAIDIVNIIIQTLNELLPDNDIRKNKITTELIEYVEDRKGHDKRYAIDSKKITDELEWKPEVMFEEGIKMTIKWYLENTEWIENITSGKYKESNDKI